MRRPVIGTTPGHYEVVAAPGAVGVARRGATVAIFCLMAIACGTRTANDASTWQGTITTDGAVTTVRTTGGSVWGGMATLVEEASIGVEIGADEYMLGDPWRIWATDDRIYVADAQIPIVRAYDYQGRFLHEVGREGQKDPGSTGFLRSSASQRAAR